MRNQVGWWVHIRNNKKNTSETEPTSIRKTHFIRNPLRFTLHRFIGFKSPEESTWSSILSYCVAAPEAEATENACVQRKNVDVQYRNCLMQRHVAFDLLHLLSCHFQAETLLRSKRIFWLLLEREWGRKINGNGCCEWMRVFQMAKSKVNMGLGENERLERVQWML